ncbi:D-glycero-beta-D-manno-heptose 1-phosphate adenylyltransferase [Solirubrobacter sp. CPCC 204708]|uniref:D-glycero-beta-D-manno-heptose 1-phosphate adenylyltransferase n=1 Tax=Solirubrobacter deserti TaxID=2282478 RepID=A0ABT4RRY0_9ACTN|nr:D-glycero-beta-D-manno-heptose 1-phosphate adenylyltransferase [Solirubrobacter deserti]MBE2320054.1 D-glycero-beta-D-manno-heptose 1-phosphate adenylyltransferase [Solirubrobacter deserti]MDA0141006.1 D-glycero-beta-D-manno-heptose 1-phosphate adenylyltransferase [Solirubrobacter deserti]
MTRLIVIGDALLDRDLHGRAERLAPDAPVPVVDAIEPSARAGGAALAAMLAARTGVEVTLVTALGRDAAGEELRSLLKGIDVIDLGLHGATPEKIRVLAGGRPVVRLDRGGESRGCGPLPDGALDGADAILVSDYGRGVAAEPTVRAALSGDVPVVWDPHPKGPEPVPGCILVTPNAKEATASAGHSDPEDAARTLVARWRAVAVAVTRGERGALMVSGDGPALAVPVTRVSSGDPCGAGDAFAATAASRIASGALPSEAVREAVEAASAFVAGEAEPASYTGDAVAVAERVRAAGGTVVATGGCFDLLHAGHVRMLEQARALGDCLIVCLNSDASVSRLKGPDRPLVEQDDRAAVLKGLGCVDAVVIFDEDDPREAIKTIKPHVWAKGGDYAVAELPEAQTLAEWGGRAVIVPYVAGRSTTRLITEVLARAR